MRPIAKTLKQECEDLFRDFGQDRKPDKFELERRIKVKMERARMEMGLIKLDLCLALKAV